MKLIQYEATIKALAELMTFPEVKKIRDQAVAVEAYAKQAKDPRIIAPATEIRVTAETKAGQLLIDMGESRERARQGQGEGRAKIKGIRLLPLKVADLKISKMQSSRWQKLARIKKDDPQKWQQRLEKIIRMNIAITEGDAAVIKAARLAMRLARMERRKERTQATLKKIKALPDKRYGVVYADPEWTFKTWDGLSGGGEHYAVSSLDDIKARDVPKISAPDCVLFLWAIVPMLPHALEVMQAWGFKYVSHCIWNKNRGGTGYWFINWHELLLVGVKGNIPAPLPGTQWPSMVKALRGKHSQKPEKFAEMIEQYFPDLPKIELNRRGPPRKGWDAWGAEAEAEAAE